MKNFITKHKKVLIVLAVVVVIIGSIAGTYNNLQSKDENVTNKWSQVENQLQRRYDLIPNLVAVVKQYSDYETTTFEKIVALRNEGTVESEKQADEEYKMAIKALTENYPELKAIEQYNDLMTNLEGTENRIAVARKDYNDAVTKINASINISRSTLFITKGKNIDSQDLFLEALKYYDIDEDKYCKQNGIKKEDLRNTKSKKKSNKNVA